MKKIEITADKYGITISHPTRHKYVIGWWQIERDGFTYWHDHLREKQWFDDRMSREFTDLCMDHFHWR